MKSHTLLLARWAVRICTIYQRHAERRLEAVDHCIGKIGSALDSITRTRRRLATCRVNAWRGAAKAQLEELRYSLRELREESDDCQRAMETAEKPVPDPRHFLQELQQLESEFGEVDFDQEHAHLTVTTESIAMQGIHLGRFEIRLELNRLEATDGAEWLRIIAREPNAAGSDSTVTHPHVRDERLCAGEAVAAMGQALACGRLCDLFLLARSVLRTYNDDSPHVALDQWDGNPCYDCGFNMASDESCWCHGCERDFCDQCYTHCRGCDDNLCRGCLAPCYGCEDLCCGSCVSLCADCKHACCRSCLDKNLCPDCQPGETNDDHSSNPASSSLGSASCAAGIAGAPCPPGGVTVRAGLSPSCGSPRRRGPSCCSSAIAARRKSGDSAFPRRMTCCWSRTFGTVKQATSAVSVAFDDAAVAEFFDAQVDAGRRPEQFGRIWLHTHPGSSPEPSSLDEDTFDRVFGGCQWAVMFILASGGDTYARLRFNVGPGGALLIPVEVDYRAAFPASDHDAWLAEYEQNIHPLPERVTPSRKTHPRREETRDEPPVLLEEVFEDELFEDMPDRWAWEEEVWS